MQIRVLIPAYKNETQLVTCRAALEGQIAPENIVVHNDSEPEIGFVRSVNTLIQPLLGTPVDYAIILNQDCYLRPGAIDKMANFMEEHPKCAIGGIKHFGPGDDDTIIHGGCTQAFPHGRHIVGSRAKGECSENAKMPWVNGACMIVRVAAIPDFGLMDNNFKMICSDSDWCYTARDRGWEVWYIADAECLHEHGISGNTQDAKMNRIKLNDTIRFRDKWITDGAFRELVLEIF